MAQQLPGKHLTTRGRQSVADVKVGGSIPVGDQHPLLVIAGPCVIESRQLCLDVAGAMKEACAGLALPYVFKASFDKANRTSISSFRGVGLEEGLIVLEAVKDQIKVPVLTDIHLPYQAAAVAEVVDVIQIPAFLCRQTDLLVAAARTGLAVNIKKGQFMAAGDMGQAAEKVSSMGNENILLCERGSSFGYHDLIVDMRSIVWMKQIGYPVVFDATHATQKPAARGSESGGDRDVAPALARAAVAAGADGVFLETHPDPDAALSDSATMIPLGSTGPLLARLRDIAAVLGRKL
jgi:2-dehydro-3-deoxyphosphooctonate aldolase (KDO 8-P synthase)